MAHKAHPFHRLAGVIATGSGAERSWRVLLVLLIVAVGYLALTPHAPKGIDAGWDKCNHILAFTALALSACLGHPASRRTRLLLLYGLLVYGGSIELMQLSVPGRSAEWGDLLADSIGIACGAVIAALVLHVASARLMRGH